MAGVVPPAAANEEIVDGALLFADISGFTPLAERLARHGPVGAEQLSRFLNEVFGRLAVVIDKHGGEIVTFAGDAVVALWASGTDGLGPVTRAAARCGLAVQAALDGHPAPEGRSLSLRVGIGAGGVRLPQVGGRDGRWLFLALGPALDQVREVMHRADRGEVVLSGEAWAHDSFVGERREDGLFRLLGVDEESPLRPAPPRAVPVYDAALRALAPTPVLARLGVAGTTWSAELRQVSILFLNLIGSASSPSLRVIDALGRALQASAARYESTLKELSADDKGIVGILVLGLAPLAHEDDRRRAVLAALDLHARLAEQGIACGIGVASGRVFCGSIETATRSDYAVVGDPMNLAARLMQAATATGDVLCDEATHQPTRSQVLYEALSPIRVKGRSGPVPVWRPLGPASTAPPPSPMVGRRAEQSALDDRLRDLQRGNGALVVIEGEAGIGKSRLADELVRRAEADGVLTATGAGDAIERAVPYRAWRSVFATLCGAGRLGDPASARQWVAEHLPDERDRQLLPLLEAVLPLGAAENAITSQMSGGARAEMTADIVLRLFRAVILGEGQPLLILLDDGQWLDSASWALAERVAADRRVLLVVCKRPWEEEPPTEASFLDAEDVHRLTLGGLAPAEIGALVAERLGVEELPDDVGGIIVERAEGNPFFSEELAYSLRDAGLIVVSDGVCQVARGAGDLRAHDLPDTLEAVVMSRVDRLPPGVQLTLKVASVAGPSFSLRLLEEVHPVAGGHEDVPRHLSALASLDLLTLETPGPEPVYAFRHTTIREVVYNLMLFAQRRALHAAVAEWYERRGEDVAGRFALLAHHWAGAEVADKAALNLGLAGDDALHDGAYREAVRFLEDALTTDPEADTVRRAGWERRIGEAELGRGRPLEAREHLRRAVALAGWPEPRSPVGLVLRLASQLAVQALSRFGLRRVLFRTRASAEQNAEAAAGFVRLVETYWFSDNTLALAYAAVAGLNVAERAGPSPDLARAYAIVCLASSSVPLHRLARGYASLAMETAEAVGQLAPIAYCSLISSIYRIGVGEWHQAMAGLRRAREIFEQLGDRRFSGHARALMGMAAAHLGDFSRGAEEFAQVAANGEQHGSVQHQVWGLTGQAFAAVRTGRPEEAIGLLERARALATDATVPAEEVRTAGLLAVARLHNGEPDLALESAINGWQAMQSRRSVAAVNLLQSQWALADAVLALWEEKGDPAARELAGQVCKELHRFARLFPIGRPRALVDEGLVLWLEGRADTAREAWNKGLREAERLEMPYEIARAHYEIGRHLVADERARRAHLEQAAEVFGQIGAHDDLARARGALASAG